MIARLAIVPLALCCATAAAQQPSATRGNFSEYWPELAVYRRLGQDMRVKVYLARTTAVESAYHDATLGAEVDWGARPLAEFDGPAARVTPDFIAQRIASITFGLNRTAALGADRGDHAEVQIYASGTFTLEAPYGIRVRNRSRVDVRYVDKLVDEASGAHDTHWSWRYRNRTRVDRDFETQLGVVTPYSQLELFYDGRAHSWNRYRLAVGVEFPVWKQTAYLDTYLTFQGDRSSARTGLDEVRTLGTTLNLYF